jgi:proteasome lid subunit RPN8/RPN11
VIRFEASALEDLVEHAREGYPYEVCGVLLGKTRGLGPADRRTAVRAFRARNLNVDRARDRFTLAPEDLARADGLARELGLEVTGFYHSHPDHPARASVTDLENSSPWGGYSYPIVSVMDGVAVDVKSWAREGDAWVEETIEVAHSSEPIAHAP